MSCIVRKATLDDLPAILVELKKFSEFYGSTKPLYKDDKTTEIVIGGFIREHVFFVATDNEKVVGFISGMILPHIYNPDIITLAETFWWVTESYRHSKAALKLLNAFVEYGKEHVDWVICTIEDNSPIHEKSFLKRGFRPKEVSYLLEVN